MNIRALTLPCLLGAACALAQENRTVPAAALASPAKSVTAAEAAPAPSRTLQRVRLPVATTAAIAAKYRLFDTTGQPVAGTVHVGDQIEAEVHPNKVYVIAPPAGGRQTFKRTGAPVTTHGPEPLAAGHAPQLEFPARYVAFDQNGKPYNEGGLFLRAARIPLVWSNQDHAYATDLIVGYDFKDGHEQALPAPKTVAFFVEGADAHIQAQTVVINRSGAAGYQRVVLTTSQHAGDAEFTARAGPLDELQAAAPIEREPGRFDLTLPSRQIDAFGLGTGTLTVTLLARDGAPLVTSTPLRVQLSSRSLKLPTSIPLAAGQSTATTEVRSLGFGDDRIVAEVGSLQGTLPVRLVFPMAAVVAAVLGGALGGGARYLRNRRHKSSLLARRLTEGVLVGVLFVGAAWAGLVTTEMNAGVLSTPFGAFVLAAFSGYLGCVVLDRIAKRLFPGAHQAA